MEYNLPITFADKINSAAILAIMSKLPANTYLSAEQINQIKNAVNELNAKIKLIPSAYLGSIVPTGTPTGTGAGYWTATQAGTYTNFGGVVVVANSLATISRDSLGDFTISQTPLDLTTYVKSEDINSPVYGKNMFDKTAAINDRTVNTADGTLTTSTSWFTTDFIQVNQLSTYVANEDFTFIGFYNSSKVFISGITAIGQRAITTPSNTKYLRLSVNNVAKKPTLQIEKGTVSTSYVVFETIAPGFIFIKKDVIKKEFSVVPSDSNIVSEKVVYSIKESLDRIAKIDNTNLFDKTTVTKKAYPDPGNAGQLTLTPTNPDWNASDFIPVLGSTSYRRNTKCSFVCFYDVNKVFISGIGAPNQFDIVTPPTARFIRVDVKDLDITQIEIGTVSTPYVAYKAAVLLASNQIKYNTIVATRNAANFNSIREIISGITDATANNRYVVFVPNGEWFECDLIGKKYVEIVGQDRELTILYNDGLSTKLTPADYSFSGLSNTALNTLTVSQKHCFNLRSDAVVSNLTVRASNSKYCLHLDNPGYLNSTFINVIFDMQIGTSNPVGIGTWNNQRLIFESCIFKNYTGFNGIFVHNTNAQMSPTFVGVYNSQFKNCSRYMLVDELASGQSDVIELINCTSDQDSYIELLVEAPGVHLDAPYNIKLNITGTKVTRFYDRNGERPNFTNYVIGEYGKYNFSNIETAPATASSVGFKGEVRVASSGVYYCISANTWKFISFSTF